MNHKEEPSANSQRSSPSAQVDLYHPDDAGTETTGPLSRPGSTAAARAEKPALSEDVDSLMERVVEEASPQGGPLSPLLSNILLDDLDKELERRGLPFVRYADDFAIFAKSARAADRILASISRQGPWHMSKTIASGVGLTNAWLAEQGMLSLKSLWAELAHLR